MLARDYQARDMRYVGKEYRTDGIGDLAEFFKFDLARICARAAHDHLRLYDLRDFHHFVVVYASVKLYAVKKALVNFARATYLCAVSEVSAVT